MAETGELNSASSTRSKSGQGRGSDGGSQAGGLVDTATGMIADAKNVGNEVIGVVRDSALSLLDDQRNRAIDQIAGIGEMLVKAVEGKDELGPVAQYANQTGQQIGDFAEGLRDRSWGELAADLEHFGRRWPFVFIAASVGAGFLAGRFLVASAGRASTASSGQLASPERGSGFSAGDSHGSLRQNQGQVSGSVAAGPKSGYGSSSNQGSSSSGSGSASSPTQPSSSGSGAGASHGSSHGSASSPSSAGSSSATTGRSSGAKEKI